ncbi:MAG TPA: crosslink repair DNA glycosylase YcaQ family protein, partial [Mycobacteriales bacterium]|nr:crosslink repair DNA glycosylase YcaQ family protein [Mycobacteriales bacterium]
MPPRRRAAEPGIPARWDQVLAWRLERQHLAAPAPVPAGDPAAGLVALVRRLSGVHAQLASAAEAAVRLRTGGALGAEDVRAALTEHRTLVKTWAVRGTLHLLPAADLPRWAAALGTRTFPRPESWYRYHGVTPEDMAAVEETVPQVLSGTPVTREELAEQVARRSGRPEVAGHLRSGWGALLKPLAARGQLVFGPAEGRNVTFVAPGEWLGRWPAQDPEEAVAAVVRDFLD